MPLIMCWHHRFFYGRDAGCVVRAQFLPFAQIAHGRQLLGSLLFVLSLDPELEEERLRLLKLTKALEDLQASETLRRLYEICAEIHEEMRLGVCSGGHDKALSPKSDSKQEQVVHFRSQASQMWRTGTELSDALKKFNVYRDNGELNFGCLKAAGGIQLSRLPGKSLLQVVLLRCGAAAHSEHQPCQPTAQERVRAEVKDGKSARHCICPLNVPSTLLTELHMDFSSTETSITNGFPGLEHISATGVCKCHCAVCRELGAVCGGRLRKWQKLMKSPPFLGRVSERSRDRSFHGHPGHYSREEIDDTKVLGR